MSAVALDCDVLVVGSGPGGATTACLLAEAGIDVLLVEEGRHFAVDSAPSHSLQEMEQKWRNGGITPTFGETKITYIEGRCVGGASETNAGLYHAPIPSVLEGWAQRYGILDFGEEALAPFVDETCREMSVSTNPAGLGEASRSLEAGADKLGWKNAELARFWRYEQGADGDWSGHRQSMTETMVPRALAAGCRLRSGTRVKWLVQEGSRFVQAEAETVEGKEPVTLRFSHVFVCAGAIQTPLLLRRSGLRKGVGDSLTLNPMIRVAARFDHEINEPHLGVPVQQVEAFKPQMTLGCSHSSVPHLALWLGGSESERTRLLEGWRKMAIFYVKICGSGRGRVRNLPLFDEALVRHPVTADDIALLRQGLGRLGQLLFASGAVEIYSPIPGAPSLAAGAEPTDLGRGLDHANANLSAIHLHSTCPMGEVSESVVDSHGKLRGFENAWLNDASILPDTPGINPQGTLMAIARRNLRRYLENRGA